MRFLTSIIAGTVVLTSCPAQTGQRVFSGPVQARVVSVLDGDTFLADARVWPGQTIRVNIRIRGIDTPESRGRCAAERDAARRARAALAELIAGRDVTISNIAGAKYYGRVLADVAVAEGNIATTMLAASHARPYGGGRRLPWC